MFPKKMKPYHVPLLVLLLFTLISCAGSKAAQQAPDPVQPAAKELNKGIGWYQKGCYHNSLEHLLRAHELFTALDDLPGIAMSMNNIGNVYRKIGDARSALLFFESSLAIYQEIDDADGEVQALSNKAAVLIQEGRPADAEAALNAAFKITDRSGKTVVALLNNQGVLLTRRKAYAQAEETLVAARNASDPENLAEYASVNFSLGNLMAATGRYDEGLECYRKALDADRKSGFHNGIADDLAVMGTVYQRQGNHAAAAAYYQRSIKIYALLDNEERVTSILKKLEVSAGEAQVDITVTRHFVSRWASGEVMESPCK